MIQSEQRHARGEECEKNNACIHIIVHIPGEKPQRIFENLQGSLKICKDLQKTFEDEDLQKISEDLHLVKVGVKILMGAVRIL